MNQTLISTVVSDLLRSTNPDHPYQAPKGFVWQKNPDEYDHDNDMIWEGSWNLVQEIQEIQKMIPCGLCKLTEKIDWCCSNESKKIKIKIEPASQLTKIVKRSCEWNCPNGHMEDHYCYESDGGYDKWLVNYKKERIESQREAIARTLNPAYHVCTHDSHDECTNSVCCDFFWHEGDCEFVSDVDEKEQGFAVRFGDQ
jgi:hypothetical protein